MMWFDNVILVSDKVKEAFDEADSIVFELKLHDPETIETLMRCKNLEDGMRIRDILPFDIYVKLKLCKFWAVVIAYL